MKVLEAKRVAEYFFLMNETNWNKFDDSFYIINRRWFDRWKDYTAYDYIVRFLVDQTKKGSELNHARVMANNSNPGEVSNLQLIMDRKECLQLRNSADRLRFTNAPLKMGLSFEKDYFLVSEGVWRIFRD
jgi:hypothetical protein